MELSAPGAKDLGRGGGRGTWPALGLPRAHSIQSQITTLILHHEMVQVNHLALTAVFCALRLPSAPLTESLNSLSKGTQQ